MNYKVGIRYEDKFKMERRVAIVPSDVRALIEEEGLEFFIEKSAKRVFKDEEYRKAGATLVDDVSDIPVIFGVKEMPLDFFRENQTYVFFSHTIKGQSYNMPALRTMMDKGVHLIDYEKVTDAQGRRLIFFGRFAGLAGMINSLWAMGLRFKEKGFPNPFEDLKQSHEYDSLEEARDAVAEAGRLIGEGALEQLPFPFVIAFTGYGNVSKGAQEIADLLPVSELSPGELIRMFKEDHWDANSVYKVIFREEHLVKPLESGQHFELNDYYQYPQKYQSDFDQYIDKITLLMNCMYWDDRYPRLITKKYLSRHYRSDFPLTVIGDVTCDPDGSVEITHHCTQIESPNFVYDPHTGKKADGHQGNGILVMAVDILPSELPRESSKGFSTALLPFIGAIAKANYSVPFEKLDLPSAIKRAMILHNGKLTPDYEYMLQYIEE